MTTWTRYSPEPVNGRMDPMDVINSPAFGPAVMRAIQDHRIAGYLVPRSIPQRAVDIPVVEDLPVNPQDGDEVHLLVDDGVGGVFWHLRYRGSEANTSRRWKFLGGTPLFSEVTPEESTTSTSYTNLSTGGPAIRLPLPGDYDIAIGCMAFPQSGAIARMSYEIGSITASDNDACRLHVNATQGSVTRKRRKTSLSGPIDITAKYKTSTGTSAFAERWICITPIRVGRT